MFVFTLNVDKSNTSLPTYSDKANLPPDILHHLIESGIDFPHPLVFKVTNESNPTLHTYIGVKEFTSESEEVVFPRSISTKLQDPTRVIVELEMNVVKANSLRLKPSIFYPVSNWKYFLESKLQNYTVVEKNDTITIEEDGLQYQLQVEQINGSDSVNVASIIDTDVVLDVVPLSDAAAEQQMEFNKSYYEQVGNVVELKKDEELVVHELSSFLDPKFVPRLYKVDITKWGGDDLWVELEMKDSTHLINVDCVVGMSKLLNIEHFAYSTLSEDEEVVKLIESGLVAKKTIHIDLKKDELILNKLNRCKQISDDGNADDDEEEKFIYLIAFTWKGVEDLQIRVTDKQDEGGEESSSTTDSKRCPNCSKLIPKENFLIHELRCHKQKAKPVDANLLQFKHTQLYEKQYHCCSETFDTFFDLVRHKATCPKTVIECRFCHLIVPQETATYQDNFEGLTHHENLCGNKTEECIKCGKFIRRKDMVKHMKVHELEKIDYNEAITFHKCANVNCINNQATNELNLCEFCFGPLYIPQHDPSNIKLQSRIERRYMLQLTKGCGQGWCNNEYCKTGNPKMSNNSMKDALQIMKQLFESIHQPRLPINEKNGVSVDGDNRLWFCVTESVSKKKLWFDLLTSEGNYSEEAILQALKVSSGELQARQWLKNNAIAK